MSTPTLMHKWKQRRADREPERPPVPRSIEPSTARKSITLVILVAVGLYFFLPVLWLISQTTRTYGEMISATDPFSFGSGFIKNFHTAITYDGGYFPTWVWNSIFYSTVSAVVGTLVSLACGYAFAKFRFPYKRVLFGSITAGMLLPAALLTIPMFFLFNAMGIVNTIWAILIPCSVSPFGVFLGIIYCQTVPDEMIQAARIDGASEIRIFFTMVLRLLAPAVVTIALFIFVGTWNNFLLPLVMLRGRDLLPVTLGLYTWQNYKAEILTSQVLMGSLIGVIPVVVLFLALQRYWRAGLAAGAVKQ